MNKSHALLQSAAAQFRYYEAQHRSKLGLKALTDLETEDTVRKADVNAEKALEIELFLADEARNSVRSPDIDHVAMVTKLQKPGADILAQMTPLKIMCLHMAGGAASEGGELFDAIKRWALFGKDLDVANVIEELGDLEFFMEGLRQNLSIPREVTLVENMSKLGVRYENHVFSDEATIARADKNLADAPQSEVEDAADMARRFKEEAGLEKPFDDDPLIDTDALGGTTDGSMR